MWGVFSIATGDFVITAFGSVTKNLWGWMGWIELFVGMEGMDQK